MMLSSHFKICILTLATRSMSAGQGKRPTLDVSKFINEADLDEVFISGSGPGGQSVNKAVNCCQLKHKPTGLVVKVHQTRSLEKNRKLAREILAAKLDNLYNGEQSLEARMHREALQKISIRESQAEKRRAMKEEYKRRLIEQTHDT